MIKSSRKKQKKKTAPRRPQNRPFPHFSDSRNSYGNNQTPVSSGERHGGLGGRIGPTSICQAIPPTIPLRQPSPETDDPKPRPPPLLPALSPRLTHRSKPAFTTFPSNPANIPGGRMQTWQGRDRLETQTPRKLLSPWKPSLQVKRSAGAQSKEELSNYCYWDLRQN